MTVTETVALDWERLARAAMHPTRIRILEVLTLSDEPRSPKQIADACDLSLGQVSYHFRQLAEQDLIALAGTAPRRGAVEHFYRLS